MSEPDPGTERTEERLARYVRALPPRPAPRGLEARILRELGRRAARPWWLRSFGQWPSGARAVFVCLSVVLVGLGVLGGDWISGAVRSLQAYGAADVTPAHHVLTALTAVEQLGTLFASIVPSAWLHTALLAGAVLYVTLLGLGALAYRLLFVDFHKDGLAPLSGGLASSNGRYS
ncbi:MAG TPA: hypothetical protein VHZ53_13760 [Steroidobacteraceae bacterium]|jgi:hypothetical protein|nr:hypothetical protein [Steroidobacteraceae bacterium]